MSASYKYIFSLGYRCSSAGVLKSLGIKHASYPFDWMVSRLPIIADCIDTKFVHFLNPENYVQKESATYDYRHPLVSPKICDENICYNRHYEAEYTLPTQMLCSIPPHLSPERDAYAHKLMMNHHNILSEEDRAYYERCVGRWNEMMASPAPKLSLYIHPCLDANIWSVNKDVILEETREFHGRFSIHTVGHDGIYIFPVRTIFATPTNETGGSNKYVLEEYVAEESLRICILWANCDFLDAGTIFMGESSIETWVITDYVSKIASQSMKGDNNRGSA